MRIKNLSVVLGLAVCPIFANFASAGVIAGQTYIYVANDGGSDSITTSTLAGGAATKLDQLATDGSVDPHQLAISGNFLFVANDSGSGTVSEFLTNGASTSNLISTGAGNAINGLAVSGNDLFTVSYAGVIGEYSFDSTGKFTLVNADVVTVPSQGSSNSTSGPYSLAISGSDLYVDASTSNRVYGFTTSGTDLSGFGSSNVIGGVTYNYITASLNNPEGVAVDGSGNLYVANTSGNSVTEYNAGTGALENGSFVTGLNAPAYVTAYGSELLVSNHSKVGSTYTVGEYSIGAGGVTNSAFINSGLNAPFGIAVGVAAVPLPNTAASLASFLAVFGSFGVWKSFKRRASQVA